MADQFELRFSLGRLQSIFEFVDIEKCLELLVRFDSRIVQDLPVYVVCLQMKAVAEPPGHVDL